MFYSHICAAKDNDLSVHNIVPRRKAYDVLQTWKFINSLSHPMLTYYNGWLVVLIHSEHTEKSHLTCFLLEMVSSWLIIFADPDSEQTSIDSYSLALLT